MLAGLIASCVRTALHEHGCEIADTRKSVIGRDKDVTAKITRTRATARYRVLPRVDIKADVDSKLKRSDIQKSVQLDPRAIAERQIQASQTVSLFHWSHLPLAVQRPDRESGQGRSVCGTSSHRDIVDSYK